MHPVAATVATLILFFAPGLLIVAVLSKAKPELELSFAEQLYLSIKTVGTYRARLMTKLNLKTRPALVRYALKRGLLENHQAGTTEERPAGSDKRSA